MSTKVHYRPWVGKNYENGKLYGKRIMILGESHYGKELGEVNDTTSQVIEEAEFQHLYTTRFLRMVPPAVMGYSSSDSLTHEQRKEFWDSVLFYNYIQESVNGGPRGSRTNKQWSDAVEPFLEVINQYKPEIILVFGVGIGNNLTRKNAVNKDIKGLKAVEYTLNEGIKSIAVAVRHPAGGMSYKEVHNVVDKILK
jgi:hypothetical protein